MVSDPTQATASDAGSVESANEAMTGGDARLAEIQAQLDEALTQAEKTRDEFLRARAEADNTRRRAQEDVSKAHKFGIESFATALLGVKDSLDAALTVETASVESFREGVELTARQLDTVFEKFALRPIAPAVGDKFDPHRHQAIGQVESAQEPNTVAQVLQKGYLLHDRVVRPALVMVARMPGNA